MLSFLFGVLFLGCIWDGDTLADELRGVPQAEVLVTGRWYRHGEAYYKDRLSRLVPHLEKEPDDLAAYDDVAVAWERLGRREDAIAVMKRKADALERKPDAEHQYRYHANLGTFLAHSGRLDEAAKEIEKAIALNPDAHFGRERFQVDLIRYVEAAKEDPGLWEREGYLSWSGAAQRQRSHVLLVQEEVLYFPKDEDWTRAYDGTTGMLRFGGLEGPELYRTLGDLFLSRNDLNLAWWCYRYAVAKKHPASASLEKSIQAIEEHWAESEIPTVPTLETFRTVQENGERWLLAFQDAEVQALRKGEDPSRTEVLERLIAEADGKVPPVSPSHGSQRLLLLTLLGVMGLLAVTLAARWAFKKRH